jgi:hypothetical protein
MRQGQYASWMMWVWLLRALATLLASGLVVASMLMLAPHT